MLPHKGFKMQKPNVSLKFAAAAITASRKARQAKTKTVRAYFQKKAQQYLAKAAACNDAGHAVRIISASNKAAVKASKRKMMADLEDDMIVDEVDMIDDGIDLEDDMVLGAEEDADDEDTDEEEVDAEDEDSEDDSDEDDSDDEVDARLASILARSRKRRMMARLKAKRQARR